MRIIIRIPLLTMRKFSPLFINSSTSVIHSFVRVLLLVLKDFIDIEHETFHGGTCVLVILPMLSPLQCFLFPPQFLVPVYLL